MRVVIAASLTIASLLPAGTGIGAAREPMQGVSSTRADFLRLLDRPRVPAAPSSARVSEVRGFVQELVSFDAERDERVPLLILKKGARRDRQAVVIALHGTNGSKEGMRSMLEGFADRGFLAVAMDARHHGERAAPIPGLANAYQSAILKAFRTGQGHPYLYDTVWDVMRLVDYLSTRPDVDPARVGLIGNSKGGTEAYLAAAADERIAAVVPLIGVQSFGWSLKHSAAWEARMWTLHEAVEAAAAEAHENVGASFLRKFYDRIAPGLVDRFDGPAMLPLVAPRPLFVINGDSDPRSPLGGVKEAVAVAERAYAAAGAREKFAFLLEPDAAHEVTPQAREAALEFLVRWLAPSR